MKLTPRLEAIAELVPRCRTAADIGTDHAYVPVRLIELGRAERVIASDVRPGPVESARRTINNAAMGKRIETRLGSGLSTLEAGEANVIIIAGMGGILMRGIIETDIETARAAEMILQPMYQQNELRDYLIKNGFEITRETLAEESFRVYNIMSVCAGEMAPYKNEIDYHIPPALYADKHIGALVEKKRREFEKITSGLERAANRDDEAIEHNRFLLSEVNRIAEELKL